MAARNTIVTRQQVGGFVARFGADLKFAKLGKTYEAAIGNLVIANKKRFGIERIVWDRKDSWTQNYIQGKHNKRKFPKPDIDIQQLPKVATPEEARTLTIDSLELPNQFRMTLLYTLNTHHTLTLGQIADCTEEELKEKAAGNVTSRRMGPKHMGLVKKLLGHYGLTLRQ